MAVQSIVCSFEAIKSISQQRGALNLGFFKTLQDVCEALPQALQLCPRLFVDQILAARSHRVALSQVDMELHTWQSYTYFEHIFGQIDAEEGASARLQTLTEVEKHVVSSVREQPWLDILDATVRMCLQMLRRKGRLRVPHQLRPTISLEAENGLYSTLISSLVILGRMNYSLLEPHIYEILDILAYVSSAPSNISQSSFLINSYNLKIAPFRKYLRTEAVRSRYGISFQNPHHG